MLQAAQILLWRTGALASLAIGIVGVAVPVLPTVPFLIVAAWAASKGWPSLERWLLEHRTYGPHIRRWRERHVVPRMAKIWATLTMLGSAVLLQFLDFPGWFRVTGPLSMLIVAIWLWRRPEH
jgi:uncharacterized membrane protein YbaN (DUF454 family)